MCLSGAESIAEIPTDKWTFVALVFTNLTSSSTTTHTTATAAAGVGRQQEQHQQAGLDITHPPDYYSAAHPDAPTGSSLTANTRADIKDARKSVHEYSVAVYLDGKLDVKMDFSQVVVGNNHSAHFFNDVSFAGVVFVHPTVYSNCSFSFHCCSVI